MQAIELRSHTEPPYLVERPKPRPGPGEVLVRMAASPINPSDLMFLRGVYGSKKPLPVVPGFEGSGTVIEAGAGLLPRLWLGRRVACISPDHGDGAWAEYMVTAANRCLPLLPSVSLEQGSMMIVNPWTAYALLDIAKRNGHRAIAHTAAASALGRMLLRLGQRMQTPIVHIVRRPAQVDMLQSLGASHILDSSAPDFDQRLSQTFQKLNVSLAFDAVGGEMTSRLLSALPPSGRVVVYGDLSGRPCAASPYDLIFQKKRVEGFFLPDWVQHLHLLQRFVFAFKVQKQLAHELRSEVRMRVPLEEVNAAIQSYTQEMTKGKILIIPDTKRGI